jgi:hypothetical protein
LVCPAHPNKLTIPTAAHRFNRFLHPATPHIWRLVNDHLRKPRRYRGNNAAKPLFIVLRPPQYPLFIIAAGFAIAVICMQTNRLFALTECRYKDSAKVSFC